MNWAILVGVGGGGVEGGEGGWALTHPNIAS